MPSFNLGIAPIAAGQGLVFSGVSLNVNAANSVEINSNKVQLAGDAGAPGNNYYYGTNSVGVKGFYLLTGAGGGGGTGGATSDQLTQTGVLLGARINTTNSNLEATGTTLYNFSVETSGVLSDRLTATGVALISNNDTISGALNLKIANTGQTSWTHGQNNATNISGRLTQTGQNLTTTITGLSGYLAGLISASSAGVSTLNSRSGNLTISSAGVGIVISNSGQTIFVSGSGGAGEVSLAQLLATSGDLLNRPQSNSAGIFTLTGNNVYYDGINSDKIITFAGSTAPSTFITWRGLVTGTRVFSFPESYRIGSNITTTGLILPPGPQEVSWVRSDSKWWLADSSGPVSELSATRAPLSTDDYRSGYAAGASYYLDESSTGLYVCLKATTSGASWYRINNPTGIFGSILLNGQTLSATGSNLYVNGNLVSGSAGGSGGTGTLVTITGSSFIQNLNVLGGGGTQAIYSGNSTLLISSVVGTGTALSVTGSNILSSANVIGLGSVTAYLSGQNLIVISGLASIGGSGGTGLQTGVTNLNTLQGAINVIGAGNVTVSTSSPNITVSGTQPNSGILAPGFNYINGGNTTVTVTGDPWIANKNTWIYATGGNISVRLTGIYDGFNGTIFVEKQFDGTGEIRFSSNSRIINATGQISAPLSFNSGALDAFSFVHNSLRPVWVASSLSGISSISVGGSSVTVTGSNSFSSLNVIGAGNVTAYVSGGSTLVISGLASAGGAGTGTFVNITGSSSLAIANFTGTSGIQITQTNATSVRVSLTPTATLPRVSVLNFGADNTGGTQAAAAFNAAINYVASLGGGVVVVPAGTYLISGISGERILLKTKVKLEFSPGVTLTSGSHSATSIIIDINTSVQSTIEDVIIEGNGVSIVGNRSPSHTQYGIQIATATNGDIIRRITIRDVNISNCRTDGITIGGNGTAIPENILLERVISDNCFRNGGSLTHGKRITVTDSIFKNTNGTSPQAGFDVEPDIGLMADEIVFNRCFFDGNIGNGLYVQTPRVSRVRIIDCCGATNSAAGLAVFIYGDFNIAGGTFNNNGAEGVYAQGYNLSVNGVISYGNTGDGFKAAGARSALYSNCESYSNTLIGFNVIYANTGFKGSQTFNNCSSHDNTSRGLSFNRATQSSWVGGSIYRNASDGVQFYEAQSCGLFNCFIAGNGTSSDLGADNIILESNSCRNQVNHNKISQALNYFNGTATAGSSTTVTLPASRYTQSDDYYEGMTIRIVSGTGSGQTKTISGYVASTGVVTVSSAWSTNPDSSSVVEITSTNRPRYGIRLNSGNNNNYVIYNDATNSGGTGSTSDAGTSNTIV